MTTPQEVALADVRKAIAMFKSMDIRILGIVENMAYFCLRRTTREDRDLR